MRFPWQPDTSYLASSKRSHVKEVPMAEAPRITAQELKKRMEAGEDFTIIDVRNPEARSESDTMIPEAIRMPLEKVEENLPRIPKGRTVVSYCT